MSFISRINPEIVSHTRGQQHITVKGHIPGQIFLDAVAAAINHRNLAGCAGNLIVTGIYELVRICADVKIQRSFSVYIFPTLRGIITPLGIVAAVHINRQVGCTLIGIQSQRVSNDPVKAASNADQSAFASISTALEIDRIAKHSHQTLTALTGIK